LAWGPCFFGFTSKIPTSNDVKPSRPGTFTTSSKTLLEEALASAREFYLDGRKVGRGEMDAFMQWR
jgi:hypothetical protein